MNASDEQVIGRAFAIAERVARACVPDLNDKPLYLVQPDAGSLLTRDNTGWRTGLFWPGLDAAIRPQLEQRGTWRGPGVAVAVDGAALYCVAANDDDGLRSVVGTTLHELCHWLEWQELALPAKESTHAVFVAACDRHDARPISAKISHDFLWHGESFTRYACHLWYRANHGGGCLIRPCWLSFGSDYGGLEFLPSPMEFIESLGDEMRDYASMRLADVGETRPPIAYVQLWNHVFQNQTIVAAEDAA